MNLYEAIVMAILSIGFAAYAIVDALTWKDRYKITITKACDRCGEEEARK